MKHLLLSLPLFIASSLLADNQRYLQLGDEFCHVVVNQLAMGTHHIFSCLGYVENAVQMQIDSEQEFIESICAEVVNFIPSANSSEDQERCLLLAREEGFLPQDSSAKPDSVRIIATLKFPVRTGDVDLSFNNEIIGTLSVHGTTQNQVGFIVDHEQLAQCLDFAERKKSLRINVNGWPREIKSFECIWPVLN